MPGTSIHSFPVIGSQQTKDRRPPRCSARLTEAKAATGSAKNITPNRE
jgi:hypothetical protein